jgi:hypothetical protein
MIALKDIALALDNDSFDLLELVTILELTKDKLNINTISEMARQENKSPNGIRVSNKYRKIKIGKQIMVVKGVDNSNLPF